jgi:hypothetical protein
MRSHFRTTTAMLIGLTLAAATPAVTAQQSADLNCDGVVNGADVGLLLLQWGPIWSLLP